MSATVSDRGKAAANRVMLHVTGQHAFTELDAAGQFPQYEKDVLRVGHWTHPDTGEDLDFTLEKLERMASDSNRWMEIGHKIYMPSEHTSDPRENGGFANRFRLDGDVLKARVEARDPEVARGIKNQTITDVSPRIQWNAVASNGEEFAAVIDHIALTPEPVLPGQGGFVPLARERTTAGAQLAQEAPMNLKAGSTTKLAAGATDAGAAGDAAGSAKGMSPKDALIRLETLLKLEPDSADWDAIVAAVQALVLDEDEEADGEGSVVATMPPAFMARAKKLVAKETASLLSRIEASETRERATKAEANEREIVLAREAAAKSIPIPVPTLDLARKLFARGEDAAAREILKAHSDRAADRSALSRGERVTSLSATTAETESEIKAQKGRKHVLEQERYTFETDAQGRIKEETVRAPARKATAK